MTITTLSSSINLSDITSNGRFEGKFVSFRSDIRLGGGSSHLNIADTALDSWLASNDKVRYLYNHDESLIVGGGSVYKRVDGLYGSGELNLDLQLAKELYSNMQKGLIDSFSVGLEFENDDGEWQGTTLYLNNCNLREISIVGFPADRSAKMTAIFSDGGIHRSERELEQSLRLAGFSRANSEYIVSRCKDKLVYNFSERGDPALDQGEPEKNKSENNVELYYELIKQELKNWKQSN